MERDVAIRPHYDIFVDINKRGLNDKRSTHFNQVRLPEGYDAKAEPIKGSLSKVIEKIHQRGYKHLYIDGGVTVQSFLKEDLIDEIIITTIPILLGGGTPLFGELSGQIEFEHVKTEVFLNAIVQNHYRRIK